MSDFYNPESALHEEVASRMLEARRLRDRLEQAADAAEAGVIARQLREVERRVDVLRHRLRPAAQRRREASVAV